MLNSSVIPTRCVLPVLAKRTAAVLQCWFGEGSRCGFKEDTPSLSLTGARFLLTTTFLTVVSCDCLNDGGGGGGGWRGWGSYYLELIN